MLFSVISYLWRTVHMDIFWPEQLMVGIVNVDLSPVISGGTGDVHRILNDLSIRDVEIE